VRERRDVDREREPITGHYSDRSDAHDRPQPLLSLSSVSTDPGCPISSARLSRNDAREGLWGRKDVSRVPSLRLGRDSRGKRGPARGVFAIRQRFTWESALRKSSGLVAYWSWPHLERVPMRYCRAALGRQPSA